MIKIFYGSDRKSAKQKISGFLGDSYEILDGNNIKLDDMPSIFMGGTFFAEKRKILIRDLWENNEVFGKLIDYINTENDVIVWESKFDKRTVVVKDLLKYGVEVTEFKEVVQENNKEVFDILNIAWRDGEKAVRMVEKMEVTQDPYMLVGLMAGQAMKKLEWKQGNKEKRVLKELSKLDIQMKTTSLEPWLLLKQFLLQVSSW